MVACKECMHIEQKDMTDEVKEDITKMMKGNVPWAEEDERG